MPHFFPRSRTRVRNRQAPLSASIPRYLFDSRRPASPDPARAANRNLHTVATVTKFCDSTPRRVWLVTSALVISEFRNNVTSVTNELKGAIEKQARTITRVADVSRAIFPEQRVEATNWEAMGVDQRVTELVNGLVDRLVVFDGSPESQLRAGARVRSAEPPSGRGKDQQYKDCEIFEAFLELVSAARSQGFTSRAILVTADKGYGKPPGHKRIKEDLSAVSAEYVTHLAWAWGMIQSEVEPATFQSKDQS